MGLFKVTSIFQRMQSNHNITVEHQRLRIVQSYLNFSKNAIKSQLNHTVYILPARSKLPQFFKECNQITTFQRQLPFSPRFKVTSIFQRMQSNHNVTTMVRCTIRFKVTSIFQRMQSNHNSIPFVVFSSMVQSYLNFSKNAIKSQPICSTVM